MRLGTTQDGSQVWRSRLSYDPAGGSCAGQAGGSNNGNVRWQEVTAPIDVGGSLTLCQTYGYDAFNRLTATQEVGSWSRTNSYDAFGNRTVNVGAAQTISPSTNQITAVAGYPTNPPDYDDAGNMIFHPQIGALGYDAENRQTSFSFSGKTGTYVYDGDGHRIKRVSTGIGGSTALFVYDAFDRLAAEYAPTAPSGAAQTEYRTADHLGSTRVVTDGTQAVVARRDFYPFGGRIENTWGGRTQIAAYAENPGFQQRFTGKERDEESGLDYFGARYHSASLGRFSSPDPYNALIDAKSLEERQAFLKNPQRWNAYTYSANSPLVYTDPDGRAPIRAHLDFKYGPYHAFIHIQPEDRPNVHVNYKNNEISRVTISEKGKFKFDTLPGKRVPNGLMIEAKKMIKRHMQKMAGANLALTAIQVSRAVGDLVQASQTGIVVTGNSGQLVDIEKAAEYLGEGGSIEVDGGEGVGVLKFEVRDGALVNSDAKSCYSLVQTDEGTTVRCAI